MKMNLLFHASSKPLILLIFILLSGMIPSAKNEIKIPDDFKKATWEALNENAIHLIGKDWMLITAGNSDTNFNMMTASWGGLGWLWEKPVSFIFVRPQRYTYKFTEREPFYTVTFYDEKYRDILQKMGSVSGRTFDKMKNSGLTPFVTENGSIAFKEARIILECKKIYAADIQESAFIHPSLPAQIYPKKDYHKMYIGEIVNVWVK
jgi:flavin reductase (DIM6/NTAB) family NADH-FMN oxidoreductase RutF